MDRITKSLLDEFLSQNSLTHLREDRAFEHFCGYLLTADHYTESFSTDDITVGNGGDCGIDSIAIIVNGTLVTHPDEIEDLLNINGYLDAAFILVQAERSESFDSSKIGQFGFGILDFFAESPSLPQNDRIILASRISNVIFSRSSQFTRGNPQCFAYYVTTGRWSGDPNLVTRRDALVQDLKQLNIFRRVTVDCLGAEKIQELYRKSKNAVSTEITFQSRTVIAEMPGVEQAFLGLLPAVEFLKLVQNDNGEILTSVFYDNVRHWQEWNAVNTEMKQTLASASQRVYFPLLNNGVTIVARKVSQTGDKFLIEDYQIVNGCQTSYVLHDSRDLLLDDVHVPVRLIATENAEIRNSIIKATNRQTQVTEDQLFSLSDFPKKLEDYFPTYSGKKRLYYERRSRQYNTVEGIEKVRIIDMKTLVRSFASVFLALPHRTTRNYKALLKTVGSAIFGRDHRLEPYYVAVYAHYRLEFLFRNQLLASELKAARYHVLLAYRILVNGENLPPYNSNDMRRVCSTLMNNLWNDDTSKASFESAAIHVRDAAEGDLHRDNVRTESFTERLLTRLRQNSGPNTLSG